MFDLTTPLLPAPVRKRSTAVPAITFAALVVVALIRYTPLHSGVITASTIMPSQQEESDSHDECARGFSADFIWGLGTAAYQIEGSPAAYGRAPSIWDNFSHTPGTTHNGDTGDVACDHVRRWREDIELMVWLGLKHYRLSLSWSRMMKWDVRRRTMVPNEDGINFYLELLEGLVSAGIKPYVTLYHWDLPQILHEQIGGWHTPSNDPIIEQFVLYARLCFERFGHLVQIWFTFNEPWTFTVAGYSAGNHAPGCVPFQDHGGPCENGDTHPYIVAHNVLIAHARAVDLYRTDFAPAMEGKISITLPCEMGIPATESAEDATAAERANEFFLGWWLQPIVTGDYPEVMKQFVGSRLPRFSTEESGLLRGSIDILSLNHYSTHLVSAASDDIRGDVSSGWAADQRLKTSFDKTWPLSNSPWQRAYAPGIRLLLQWAVQRWDGPIFITENGWSCHSQSASAALVDEEQVSYFTNYTEQLRKSITEDGVDVLGYFGWSLLDNYEWSDGYSKRFGVFWVDYSSQTRRPKASAWWWRRTRRPCSRERSLRMSTVKSIILKFIN